MTLYEKFLWSVSAWTLLEGSCVLLFPDLSAQLSLKLFPGIGKHFAEIPRCELRKYGAIELGFGLLLAGYLRWIG